MTRGFDKKEISKGVQEEEEETHRRRTPNQNIAIDPTLFDIQDGNPMRSQNSADTYERRIGDFSHPVTQRFPRALPGSRIVRSEIPSRLNVTHGYDPNMPSIQSHHLPRHQHPSGYPDAGLMDGGGLRDRVFYPSVIPDSRAAPTVREQSYADTPAPTKPNKRVAPSSRKRTCTDADLSPEAEDNLEDTTFESRRSTRRSKRAKTSPKYDHGEEKIRKISKLKIKIAQGMGPKKGSLGPDGEVRTREDGRMEFRDVNNPEWTLAAYHNNYRREFLDEAAKKGAFDHMPVRGEADDDETSYEPEQQGWGPSREDWLNIINSEGKKVMFEIDKPASRCPPEQPSNWTHDGLVLLDLRNHPVRDWPGLNKTLSTEIESWRWEALTRMYPWLTVADLLARMPHTRKKRGVVLPLQTPQAFTNRTHRFRVPNQIPASNPKNGSNIYKEEILKSLAENGANTTEGLSTLNQDQVKNVRKGNQGKFKGNSRYVVKDKHSPQTAPPSKKRKVHCDDDTESEPEQEVSKAKRQCVRSQQDLGLAAPGLDDLAPGFFYGDTNEDVSLHQANFYNEPTGTAGQWDNQEQEVSPTETAGSLVPLFLSTNDRDLALADVENLTSPGAVIWARQHGNQQTEHIGVYWYSSDVPRYVGSDGQILEDVVHGDFWLSLMAPEPMPNDSQGIWQDDSAANVAPSSMQSSFPTGFDPLVHESTNDGNQWFPEQTSFDHQETVFSDWQTPLPVPDQIRRYQTPSDYQDEVWRNHHGSAGF